MLTDASTTPTNTDFYAWEANRILVVHSTATGRFALDERWAGNGPEDDDFKYAGLFRREDSRQLWDRKGGDGRRTVEFAQAIIFRSDKEPRFISYDGIAFIESGLVYAHHFDERHGGEWVAPSGPLSAVKARILHVVALRRAFDANKATARPELLEEFLKTDVWSAKFDAFRLLENHGVEAIPVLERLLEREPDEELQLRCDAIRSLRDIGGAESGRVLTAELAREIAYWKRQAPRLRADWRTSETAEGVWAHSNFSGEALEALCKLKYEPCRKTATELCEVMASLPPYDDDFFKVLKPHVEEMRRFLGLP
ncbi:MAG TPA: hypothetical protein VFF73_35030 [Planctomycetota bacterium]|nr:hypothetical protein [Planctomycetota bacterium]